MADLNVQRKGANIWPWVIGLLVLALLVWAAMSLMGGNDTEEMELSSSAETSPAAVPRTNPMGSPSVSASALPVAQILADPATHSGQIFSGEVVVAEVVSENGFWVEDQGQRLFVLVSGDAMSGVVEPSSAMEPAFNTGDRLRILNAQIHDNVEVAAGNLDPSLLSIAETQSAFLVVPPNSIEPIGVAGSSIPDAPDATTRSPDGM